MKRHHFVERYPPPYRGEPNPMHIPRASSYARWDLLGIARLVVFLLAGATLVLAFAAPLYHGNLVVLLSLVGIFCVLVSAHVFIDGLIKNRGRV